MNVYFQNYSGKHIRVGKADDEKKAMKIIQNFCDERGFNIPYIRSWVSDGRKFFDVGSHSEFFFIEYDEDDNND